MSLCKLVLLAINERDNYFVIKAELINFKINQIGIPLLIFVVSDEKSVVDVVCKNQC